jgi:hypothetical protein
MLEQLRRLLPPPADPVEPGRPDGWAEVEGALGTELPADFKAFTELYGSGTVDDFLYLFNPFTTGQDGNLLVEKDRVLPGYRQTRARYPERLPLPAFPDPGGVLPLGGPTTVTSCTGSPVGPPAAGRWCWWSRGPPARRCIPCR